MKTHLPHCFEKKGVTAKDAIMSTNFYKKTFFLVSVDYKMCRIETCYCIISEMVTHAEHLQLQADQTVLST